ncbi:protein adenylyltransferase SelO [Sulfuritalea sp.]|uniref:protein adenylyltransferase SelO n=1 Tax=Sulfuritalea sp. TaxID=2480090 RepID=UPI001ACC789F|nr:YdiU family protein [Sulfuritalea sp.]MBN8473805.1 YdiU family protein [Sulfuritalea sp.]
MNDIPRHPSGIAPLLDLCDPALAERFDNRFVRELPADPLRRDVPRPVRNACYSHVEPAPVAAPRLLAWSDAVGALLGLARPASATAPSVDVLAGNLVLPGMQPYAARYGGHQFGNWAGQLGDGRATTLAELRGADGRHHELQLKGAGRTPYSRHADGRAVLRSSLREFLCSEAMHHLGVPTTRALSLVATGEPVERDMFYDGNAKDEPGAIVCRVAPSFLRFGNFQIHGAHDETDELRRLADHTIATHFPTLGAPSPEVYAHWYAEVCRRTARMVAEWMRVGFVHGVMNTDNMSILGLTIDYGPYGWLERYDPEWTPNTTDAQMRRYCFGRQPAIAQWNLIRLAEALLPLIPKHTDLEAGLREFNRTFAMASNRITADKLGLLAIDESDAALLDDLENLLPQASIDMTLFYRRLADLPLDGPAADSDGESLLAPLRDAFYAGDEAGARLLPWLRRYLDRVRRDGEPAAARRTRMNHANPKYVPRNYLAQLAIDAAEQGDTSVLERLMKVLEHPCDEQPEHEELAARQPEWARNKAGCSALSCSS